MCRTVNRCETAFCTGLLTADRVLLERGVQLPLQPAAVSQQAPVLPERLKLGRFFEVTQEQAAQLIEVGLANREAAAEQRTQEPAPTP